MRAVLERCVVFLSSAVTIELVLSGSFEAVVAITAIAFVAINLSGFASLFVLRAREPELLRPFKMSGYPWTNLAIYLASAAFLAASIVTYPRHAFFNPGGRLAYPPGLFRSHQTPAHSRGGPSE